MPKRKIKKQLKQKQKQNVKVSQNVKVIIGAKRKPSSKTSKPTPKPPMVINISNPQSQQPQINNTYLEYFKQQLQNQQPIKGSTLRQNEILNEREENKASRAGLLHRLDQEPADVARENRRQAAEGRKTMESARKIRLEEVQEIKSNLKPASNRILSPNPLRPRPTSQRELLMTNITQTPNFAPTEARPETQVLDYMQEQQQQLENAMEQAQAEQADRTEGAGAVVDEEQPSQNVPKPKKRGRKPYTPEQKRESDERKAMLKQDPPGQAIKRQIKAEKARQKLQA
jgi:hypothetical protein